jgi:adenylate kinase family enzyme
MFKYKKIAVIGCSGGGKTTFSKTLAEITGLPLYHLDNIYWQPDTSHLKRHVFIKKQKRIMKSDSWIIDGNYGKTIKYRIEKCELLYFFDIPTEVCLEGVLKRDRKRDDIACELEPNNELLDYIKAYREHSRPKVLKLIEEHPDKKVITFKSHKEVDKYLEELRGSYGYNI